MNTKQKGILTVLVLIALFLAVTIFVSIYPFGYTPENGGSPPPPPPPPPDPVIVIPSTPTLQPISPALDLDGSISLVWSIISEADGYQVYMSMDSISWNLIKITGVFAYVHHGLLDGVYYFKVRAYNSAGCSYMSNVRSVTVAIPVVPEAPSLNEIAPNPNTNGEIYLKWNSVAGAIGYQVWMSKDYDNFYQIKTITQIGYTHTGLANGYYEFKVRAYNTVGNSWYSDIKSVIVSIPMVSEAPTLNNLTSEPIGETVGVSLTWNDINCDGYNVYRNFNDGDYILIKENAFSTMYYDILTVAGVYSYKVSAVNIYGESELSNPISITITENGVEPPIDYTMLYILLIALGVLIVPVAIILVKRKKR